MGRLNVSRRSLAVFAAIAAWTATASAQPVPPASEVTPASEPAPAAEAAPDPGPSTAPPAAEPPSVAPPTVAPPTVETTEPESATEVEPAAEAIETPTDSSAAAPEVMVVTGSRIKRTSQFAPAAPVQIIDRKQLEYSGAQSIGDVVQYLGAASGSDFNGREQGSWGVSRINLRGLGAQATLVLINGRRVVASSTLGQDSAASFVDVGQIPISAVERIEVMRGGGSAIYGADAIAGVVNIITRKNYDGLRIDGTALSSDKFDHSELSAGATFGAKSEHARVNLSVGLLRQSPLAARDRAWTAGKYNAQIGNPGTFITTQLLPDPSCAKAPSAFVVPQAGGGGFCSVDNRNYANLAQPIERISTLGTAEYDLSNHTTVFLETGLASLRAQEAIPPSLPVLQPVFVPADHLDNPFGARAQYLGSPVAYGAHNQDVVLSDEDTIRFAGGIKGDFGGIAAGTFAENWEWELSSTWGRTHLHGLVPDTVTDRLQTALDSCSDPSHLANCFNPFYSAVNGRGTPNSKAVLDSFRGNMQYLSDTWMATADSGLTGKLFELPGGDAGFAIGAQYRYEARQSDVDHDGNNNRYGFVLGNSDATAHRNIGAGYLELLWPFYDGIELQTAARLEHYERVGSSVSPQASITLSPAEIAGRDQVADGFRRMRLRGTVTRAFRAPSLYEAFPGYVTTVVQFDNEGAVPAFVPKQVAGNPNLHYETALVATGGIEWSPMKQWGFSVDYWRYAYNDRIAEDDILKHYAEDRFDPNYFQRGDPPGMVLERATTNLINQPGQLVTQGLDFGVHVLLGLDELGIGPKTAGTFNFGADASYLLAYDIPRAAVSDLKLNDPDPNDNRMPSVTPSYCHGSRCNVAGYVNYANFAPPLPRFRLNVPLSWNNDHHSVAVIVHYISSYKDDTKTTPVLSKVSASNPQFAFNDIGAMLTLDLSYGYVLRDTVGKSTTVRVGVTNLLDQRPPYVNIVGGYDFRTHDPRGRLIYARLTQEF